MIYVAHPIDQRKASGELLMETILEEVGRELDRCGLSAYWPSRAFSIGVGGRWKGPVNDINLTAQLNCTGLLAILPDNMPTLGVPVEIERALELGHRVAVVVDERVAGSVQVAQWERNGAEIHHTVSAAVWDTLATTVDDAAPTIQLVAQKTRIEGVAWLPTQAHAGDAGFDLYVSEDTNLAPGAFTDVPCNVSVQLPHFTWGFLVGRSSTLRKLGLLVNPAIIDNGYRGELFAGAWNLGHSSVQLSAGTRIAQLIPIPLLAADIEPLWGAINDGDRGEAGFGSTGT